MVELEKHISIIFSFFFPFLLQGFTWKILLDNQSLFAFEISKSGRLIIDKSHHNPCSSLTFIFPLHNFPSLFSISIDTMGSMENGHSTERRFGTLAVHAGAPHDPTTGAVIAPVSLTA